MLIFYGLGEYIYKYYLLVELNRLDISNIRLTLFVSDEEKLGSYLVRLFGVYVALYISQKINLEKIIIFLCHYLIYFYSNFTFWRKNISIFSINVFCIIFYFA